MHWTGMTTASRELTPLLSEFFVSDLAMDAQDATRIAGQIERLLLQHGRAAYPEINGLLRRTSIRDRWNAVFRHYRAAKIAKWVLPHLRGSVVDILCGDGRVGRILSEFGVDVVLAERRGIAEEYPQVAAGVRWLEPDQLSEMVSEGGCGTVLLCTALHHEESPRALLDLAAKLASKRLIIIENCVEPGFSEDLHILIDDFFNCCLNETTLPCPAEHRSLPDWISEIRRVANPVYIDRLNRLPGIPLSHHLIVADTEAGPLPAEANICCTVSAKSSPAGLLAR